MVLSHPGYPEKNGTNRKVITMSDTKTITVRKELTYTTSLIKKTLADQACCRAEDVPFEEVLEFARNLSVIDMQDYEASKYFDFLGDNGEDLDE